jgi:hypothetical protein
MVVPHGACWPVKLDDTFMLAQRKAGGRPQPRTASWQHMQRFRHAHSFQADALNGGVALRDVARDPPQVALRRLREDYPVIHWRRLRRTSSTGTPSSTASERSASSMAASMAGVSSIRREFNQSASSRCTLGASYSIAASISEPVHMDVTTRRPTRTASPSSVARQWRFCDLAGQRAWTSRIRWIVTSV